MSDDDKDLLTLTLADLSDISAAGVYVYVVTPDGSRKALLSTVKTFANTDPTEVPASEPMVGAKVQLTGNVTVTSSAAQIISWGSADFDTNSFWSGGAPTRFTVPSGVTMVELTAGTRSTGSGTVQLSLQIKRNGTDYVAQDAKQSGFANGGNNCFSGPVPVTAGDYFELEYTQGSTSSRTIVDEARTFFAIKAVEHTL